MVGVRLVAVWAAAADSGERPSPVEDCRPTEWAGPSVGVRWYATEWLAVPNHAPWVVVDRVVDFARTRAVTLLAGGAGTIAPRRVEVRCATPVEVAELATFVADGGLDDDAARSGLGQWVCAAPEVVGWRTMANLASHAEDLDVSVDVDDPWNVAFCVFVNGRPVGRQSMYRLCDAGPGHLKSGSWLLRQVRGTGIGLAARRCMLAIAAASGGVAAHTSWKVGNAASAAVSRRCGYELGALEAVVEGGVSQLLQHATLVVCDADGLRREIADLVADVDVSDCPRLWDDTAVRTTSSTSVS